MNTKKKQSDSNVSNRVFTKNVLEILLTRLHEYDSITPEAACLLIDGGHSDEFLSGSNAVSGLNKVPEDVAKHLSRHHGTLFLNHVSEISDAAAIYLGQHRGELEMNGLVELSDPAADALANHQGELHLNGLTRISDAAAHALAKHKGPANHECELHLNGLNRISDAAAHALAKHEGPLGLRGLEELSDTAAEALSKHQGVLHLSGLSSLTESAATSFSTMFSDNLNLRETCREQVLKAREQKAKGSTLNKSQKTKLAKLLKTKDPGNVRMVCELLRNAEANDQEWLSVFTPYKLKVLLNKWDVEIWEILAIAMRQRVQLFETLVEAAAGRFGTYWHGIHDSHSAFILQVLETEITETFDLLDFAFQRRRFRSVCIGATELSDKLAGNLSRVGWCRFNRLQRLSGTPEHVALAESIASQDGYVGLDSLTGLSDEALAALAKNQEGLSLNGLTELSDLAAKALVDFRGWLHLNGLKELSTPVAESLACHKESLHLNGITELSDAAAEALAKHQGDLTLQKLNQLSDVAAKALAEYAGDLYMSGLNSMSDTATAAFASNQTRVHVKADLHEAIEALKEASDNKET